MTRLLAFAMLMTAHGFNTPSSPLFARLGTPHRSYREDVFRQRNEAVAAVNLSVPSLLRRSASENVQEDNDADGEMATKVIGRKKRVKLGYQVVSTGYAAITCIALSKYGLNPSGAFIAAGPFLASGIAYILVGASANDRLSSDTYKRLNLALGQFGLVGLLARGIVTTQKSLFIATSFVAMVNCIKGYGYGLKGWELKKASAVQDLIDGTKTAAATVTKIPNAKSLGYLGATLTLAPILVLNFWNSVKFAFARSDLAYAAYLFRYKKLLLLTVAAFTLKDAADRGRLEGTTFIELNFMSCVGLGCSAAYLFNESFTVLGGAMTLYACLFAFNGLSSLLQKRKAT